MVLRKPLVIISGLSSQLPPGDTIEGAAVSSIATAGSGLAGGGGVGSNFRFDVVLAANPSGLIFTAGASGLGLDGSAAASGNAALSVASSALSSGTAALSSGNAALKRIQDTGLGNLSGVTVGSYGSISAGSVLTFSGAAFIAQPPAAGGASFSDIFAIT